MKIALIGYGQMGRIIEQVAKQRNHTVVSRIDPLAKDADHKEVTKEAIQDADVCIDFTHPTSVIENIHKVAGLGKDMVVGTTGWHDKVDEIRPIVGKKTGLIYGSNFSIGVNIFFKIVEDAARLFNKFEAYDVAGLEFHHNKKADSPSGTAKTLAESLKSNIKRKNSIVYDIVNRKILPSELHFASVRVGSVPGTHKIIFDSAADTIELSHTARNREGFALGAIIAAEWISGKKGMYNISDMMKEIL
jgi:4-hydroxy-tetrahydrodipicolinate reductase